MAPIEKPTTRYKVVKNLYRDSVSLMQLSSKLSAMSGVVQASAVVASESNLDLLRDSGLLAESVVAGASDVLVAIAATDADAAAAALAEAESLLLAERPAPDTEQNEQLPPVSLSGARSRQSGANLVLISTPGEYAAAEAWKALKLGMNVMLFSDNVSEVDEVELKQYGRDHNLFVMGPDCGTAIINGVPLAFANVVKRGPIGVIAASGTGLQQVTSLIDRYGSGVSQAIGTGGHDLHENVGGITMLQAFDALLRDPDTEVIVLVSKPPAPSVAAMILAAAAESAKPVVVNFLGPDARDDQSGSIQFARTLEDAARAAVARIKKRSYTGSRGIPDETAADLGRRRARLGTGKYIRGLFSGGTFCYEALILTSEILGPVYSNTPIDGAYALEDVWVSREHTVVDLGDDQFTRGRPHPMIDHRLRNDRIVQEAGDPQTAVILLDVVLGYGSHLDPASEMVPAIAEARRSAGTRELLVIASVCGTEGDQQNLRHQERALSDAGVLLARSNAQAARFAAEVVRGL